ncbi:sensor histidine kinase [Mycobacterium conspicuum]|jgi:anti-sigma regulatory factor (Ser/Thr protein kinase)|nr:sensor histidine kinase [Mycobacterium conspicuum]ORV43798.1 regulator of Sig8 [Mycobacterium conspicuum]
MTTRTDAEHQGFVHSALLYRSSGEYVDFVLRFVLDGLSAAEPALIAVPGDNLALLRDELRREYDGIPAGLHTADITEIARNPSRFLAMKSEFAEQYRDQRVRIVSELVWPGRTDDELLSCTEDEALVNEALAHHRALCLCLYDASRLDDDVLASARATHPLLWACGALHPSADYAPHEALARCNKPLPLNPGAVTYTVRETADLRPARSLAVDYASWVGLSQDGTEDLQLIATELATNSLMYTEGGCQLAFWRDKQHLVCEARDTGRFDDPLAGRRPPGGSGTASRGLFLVNAMTDLVRTHTTTTGTTIQAYLRMDPAPRPAG